MFLACHVLEPQFPHAFQELRCEMHEDQLRIHKARLEQWDKVGITPANRTAARAVLLGIIDEAIERLRGGRGWAIRTLLTSCAAATSVCWATRTAKQANNSAGISGAVTG